MRFLSQKILLFEGFHDNLNYDWRDHEAEGTGLEILPVLIYGLGEIPELEPNVSS